MNKERTLRPASALGVQNIENENLTVKVRSEISLFDIPQTLKFEIN